MKSVYAAVMSAVIASVCVAGAKTIHGHHHHHHGHPAPAAAKQHFDNTWKQIGSSFGNARNQAEGWYQLDERPKYEDRRFRMTHPSNIWEDYCYSDSYAKCGRESLENRQRGAY